MSSADGVSDIALRFLLLFRFSNTETGFSAIWIFLLSCPYVKWNNVIFQNYYICSHFYIPENVSIAVVLLGKKYTFADLDFSFATTPKYISIVFFKVGDKICTLL